MDHLPIIIAVFLGAVVSRFSGFGFSAVAGAILSYFFEPVQFVSLMVLCTIVPQAVTLQFLREHIRWNETIPLIIGGMIGIPTGVYFLTTMNSQTFRNWFGVSRPLSVRVLSASYLEAQIRSDGATWLDRQILRRDRVQPVESGFGEDVINAKQRRVQVLIEQGFAERGDDGSVRSRRNLLTALERREVTRVGQELAYERGLTFRPLEDGRRIYGTFKETLQLASGKYALIEHSHEFTLVPWRPVLERERGRAVAGLVRGNDISWEFGRKRSLGISI